MVRELSEQNSSSLLRIERKTKNSFETVKRDIDDINTRIKAIYHSVNNLQIQDMKEKVSARFFELEENIEKLRESQEIKEGLKEDLYNILGKRLGEKFEELKDRVRKEFELMKEELEKKKEDSSKKSEEKLKEEIYSLKSQINFLKGRLNIIQRSISKGVTEEKEEEIKEEPQKVRKEKRSSKKLPVEEVKYSKDGVKPGFISKIIEGLAEDN